MSFIFGRTKANHLNLFIIHVSQGTPSENAAKIWIMKRGKCLLCNNNSQIPSHALKNIMDIIDARGNDVLNKWNDFFNETVYYC